MNKQQQQLIARLEDMFQLDQPELDFGLYKIMHAKSRQISAFLTKELSEQIDQVFGDAGVVDTRSRMEAAKARILETLGDTAFDSNGELLSAFRGTPAGKAYLEALAASQSGAGTLGDAASIYDHLYRFFNRYYDNGDFMSRRYHVAENSKRAAPYAVPYDGREVYLHWANKDQYYIKTSESFSHYTFNLTEALKAQRQGQAGELALGLPETDRKVHLQLAAADEGAHNNVKENQSRFFIIHAAQPVKLNEAGELCLQFEYRHDPEKSGQDRGWQETRLAEAEKLILHTLKSQPAFRDWHAGLATPMPTDKHKDRTLLGKYLAQYTARNTMDYFIHKDLGGFLSRELDFYIKNEIMRLDDVEQADAPSVESWLLKVKVLRKVARQIIAFLAQIEDFQKKLWLKKKFVTETQYCLTLDRVPESLYPAVTGNPRQHAEWVKLGFIEAGTAVTNAFLQANPYLLVDTAFYPDSFKAALLASIQNLDEQCDGLLIHADNFQALNLLQDRYREQVKCIYIDPPYNKDGDHFVYKDSYRHSTWLTMIYDRLLKGKHYLDSRGFLVASIDDIEFARIQEVLDIAYGSENRIANIVWDRNRKNDAKLFSVGHEYMVCYANDKNLLKLEKTELRELKSGVDEAETKFKSLMKKYKGVSDELIDDWKFYISSQKDPEIKSILKKYPKFSDRGPYRDDGNINWPGGGGPRYEVLHPITQRAVKIPKSGWRYSEPSTFWDRYKAGNIAFGEDESTVPGVVYYLFESNSQVMGSSFWSYAQTASDDFSAIMGEGKFDNPKNYKDIARITSYLGFKNSLIMDYFGGSGTTGHAVINLNREDGGSRKYILVEQGDYFDTVLKPRIQKVVFAENWKEGKPQAKADGSYGGISHCFRYLRLESYEDTLNNLQTTAQPDYAQMPTDYFLHYLLETETAGSASLLNIAQFRDPTQYRLKVKQPGSDAQREQTIDLIETFNWLIGLRVELLDQWRSYDAEFVREPDPDLPEDQHTRLKVKGRLQQRDAYSKTPGAYQFRTVEGYACRLPGDTRIMDKVLIVWRKLTDNLEQDSAALEALLDKMGVNQADSEYDLIYINGSHGLQLHGSSKSRLLSLEEAFMAKMWEGV